MLSWRGEFGNHPLSHWEVHCDLGDQAVTFNRFISYVFEPWDACDSSC